MNKLFSRITFAFLAMCLALSASAATITSKHFEGGKNLTQGSKHGSGGTLADLVMDLQDDKLDAAKLVAVTCAAGAGGAATEALTCTGLLATDTVLSVSQKTPGANSLPLLGWSTLAANAITGIWSANPGAGAVVLVSVKR